MPVIRLKRLLPIVIMLLSCSSLMAQPYCEVRTFGPNDGLVTNKVNAIAQDKNGLMWFSSWNGIMCYDGYSFTTFDGNADGSATLSSKRIYSMKKSSLGGLWCISHYGDLYYLDNVSCRFVDVSASIKDKTGLQLRYVSICSLGNGYTWVEGKDKSTGERRVVHIHDKEVLDGGGIEALPPTDMELKGAFLSRDGSEWLKYDKALVLYGKGIIRQGYWARTLNLGYTVCCPDENGRLYCYDTKTGTDTLITIRADVTCVNSIRRLKDDNLVCATNLGVVIYNMATGQSQVYALSGNATVDYIHVDSRMRLWAYSQLNGITLIDLTRNSVTQLNAQAALPEEKTGCEGDLWVEDRNHTVWCVPRGGTFSYFDEQTQQLVPYVLRSVDYKECVPDIVRYSVDNQGNLWCAASHSLHRISFAHQQFAKITLESHQETRALMYDRTGRLWAGNVNGKLALYDGRHTLTGYMGHNGSFDTTPRSFAERLYFVFEDDRERIWIATKGDGLYLIQQGKVTHYRHDDRNPYSLNCDTLFCVEQDTHGRIWVGAYGVTGGLNLVDESHGTLRFLNQDNVLMQPQGTHFQSIRRITHTADGVMILSTSDGIVTFSDSFDRADDIEFHYSIPESTSLPSRDVMQTIVMHSGRIFAATQAGELCEIDPSSLLDTLKVTICNSHSSVQGLIMSMQEDSNGQLWVVRENIIERFDPTDGNIYLYDVSLPGSVTEFSETLPAFNPTTGEMALGTIDGFILFKPRDIVSSGRKSKIVFSTLSFHDDNRPHPILYSQQVTLPSHRRSITVHFAALDYAHADNIMYAYRLEGADHDWQYIGHDHKATFSHLPSGHFRLLVKSTDHEGKWLDNTATLHIYAQPTFWESWMGHLLYILAAIVMLCLVWHYLNIRRKAKVEKEINEQKLKLYADASHRLRTPLTLIGGPVAEMLMDKDLPDRWREPLEMVRRNVRSMLEMTNNVLTNNTDNSFFVDDEHIPVFGQVDESLVGTVGQRPWDENIRLLVVEDNADLRTFLKGILSSSYNVITASNGKEGLESAIAEMPDFIITDVTMPVMDGLTMVHEIKRRQDTCHIPIIVLSAKASLEDRLKGLEEGIDDYITKPFSSVYLKNRVENIIAQRHNLQQRIMDSLQQANGIARPDTDIDAESQASGTAHGTDYSLSSPEIVDYDKQMMERLMQYLEEHIADANLRVSDMAQAAGVNRSSLFVKLKSIVGMTPVDFVRQLRIRRAIELVAKSDEAFSQIAYTVGFADPRYFSRIFKKETGMTPSEYRAAAQAKAKTVGDDSGENV